MYMKIFFRFLVTIFMLSGCETHRDWFDEYGTLTAGNPAQMQYGAFEDMSQTTTPNVRRIAVLLPTSGANAESGRAIRTSVETAVMQRAPQNLVVSFYDTAQNPGMAIERALNSNPEIIIGPLFADNARMLRNTKPVNLPVLAFTTDATAVGNGVLSVSLMPINSIEAIIKEMQIDNVKNFIIVAPNTVSGEMLAGAARTAASYYGIPVSGIFYYDERDSESIKNTMKDASMYIARSAANTRAREILSDILTHERLTAIERSSVNRQLNKISKSETLGNVPYDAVLFLGSGDDTKSLASFLRYYDVSSRDVRFYGTAQWDSSDVASDITMIGAKFSTLPPISEGFSNIYSMITGTTPTRLATFGYDATNLAMGMIYSPKTPAAYLLDPSGYVGIDGLVRLRPSGENERALRIVEITGGGNTRTVRDAPQNFIIPIYNVEQHRSTSARAMPLASIGINPNDYIQIPTNLQRKYQSKTYGANSSDYVAPTRADAIPVVSSGDVDIIVNPEYTPVELESVNRTYIDSVEIEE